MRRILFRTLPDFVRGADALGDLIWPRECPLFEEAPWGAGGYRYLSSVLIGRLPLVDREPWCTVCGHPFPAVLSGPRSCVHCAELDPEYDDGRTVLLARESGRALLHEFKYHGARHLAGDLARLAGRAPGYLARLCDATLVPIPLHPAKLRARGFNQSEAFADALARLAPGAKVDGGLLIRVRDTPSQTRLGREARLKNMHDAFAIAPGAKPELSRRHILVDDVFTTGATLNAAASALRAAGLARIGVATFAHG